MRPPRQPRPLRTGVAAAAVATLVSIAFPSAVASAETRPGGTDRCAPVLPAPTPAAEVLAATGALPTQPGNPGLREDLTAIATDAALDAPPEGAATPSSSPSPTPGSDGGAVSGDEAQLWLDTCGKAFYVDTDHLDPATSQPGADLADGSSVGISTQLYPLAETFALSSNPSSTKTIYLDFDGHTLTNTAWNATRYNGQPSVDLIGYDSDGAPGSFSSAERIAIQNIWAIVAEDYAPFDVNVTTAPPAAGAIERTGAEDGVYGTRAVVTGDTTGQAGCGCGGVAYLGVFNDHTRHSHYQPAFAYTRGAGTSAKSVAEVISHEVGHNLGLVHQGTGSQSYYLGHTPWAPIMGAAYYQPVTQWARGEYNGASSRQDQLAVMQTLGATVRRDDYGNAAAAHPLTEPLSDGVTRSGVIASPDDVDAFTFTLDSPAEVSIETTVHAVAPNLDLDLRLLNAEGTQVAADNPAVAITGSAITGMDASLTPLALNAGTYTVTVDGTGFANPASTGFSEYGSLGAYDLTVTAAYSDAPLITTDRIPAASVGAPYTAQLVGVSPTGSPLRWSLASGKLPTGLTLSPTGMLSGRTTLLGRHVLRLRAADSRDVHTTVAVTLDVATAVNVPGLTATTANAGTPFSATTRISGGTAPYTVAVTSKPAWATVTAAGAITGTPTRAENAVFDLRVTDAVGRTRSTAIKLPVGGPLRVETAGLPYAGTVVAGATNSITLTAVGGSKRYVWQPAASTLPAGMTLSTAGKVITTRALVAGTHRMTVAVRDSLGATATQSYTVTAVPALRAITTTPAYTVGARFTVEVTTAGGSGEHTVTAPGLPAGWTFDGATLAGTATSTATVMVPLRVTDKVTGRTLDTRISIAPKAPVSVATTTLPAVAVGRPITVALKATGGSGRYTWAVADGTLPAGLSLNAAGVLTGIATRPGEVDAQVRVTDSQGRTALSRILTVAVHHPLTVTTTRPIATVGEAFTVQVTSTGGSGQRTTTAGTLPTGWTFDGTTLTGTPSGTQAAAVTFTTRDSRTGWLVTTRVTVAAKVRVAVVAPVLPAPTVGQRYSSALRATGGSGRYSWTIAHGSLPAGLTLTPAGVLAGSPTQVGTGTVRFRVTDSEGRVAQSADLTVNVATSLQLSAQALPTAVQGRSYSVELGVAGGGGQRTFTASGLPSGLRLTADGHLVGAPTSTGVRSVTVTVTDGAGRRTSRTLRLVVVAPELAASRLR